MEGNYWDILNVGTPSQSVVRSSYLQKCLSSGKGKKLTFSGYSPDIGDASAAGDGSILQSTCDGSQMVLDNAANSAISGIFEFDNSTLRNTSLRGNVTSVSAKDFTKNGSVLFEHEDPGSSYTDSMFEEFLDFFLSYSGEHEIFNLLLCYEELCCSRIDQLATLVNKTACAETKLFKACSMVKHLQNERNTWRLMRSLFQDRIDNADIDEGEILMDMIGKQVSDKQIVENLYMRDSFIRQCQLVVDWLEKNANDDFKDKCSDKLEYFTDTCVSWEHTLHDLTVNYLDSTGSTRGLMFSEMDPDAPVRQKNHILHEADRENDNRLLKYVFLCLRAGNLNQAQSLSERFGEPWLAAALEGWRLHHDPNFDYVCNEGEELLPIEGNKYRDVWKAVCWEISHEPRISAYEKAVYGSLSGNLKTILPVCVDWNDALWAYVRTLVDNRIEQELRSSTQQERVLEDLPSEYWSKNFDLEQVFNELQASDSELVKSQCTSPLHVIQKYIILDDMNGLIEEMHSWLNIINGPEPHILRCMVHIILFLRVIGRSTKEELCVPIIEAYVEELIRANKASLVAPYTSTLTRPLQVMWYSRFLEGIKDNAERQKCLQYAEDHGLDIPMITKTVVENIRRKESATDEPFPSLSSVTTEEDQRKISAIDWLIFDPSQRAEALKQSNALLRLFVAQKKIDAAKQLFTKIPSDSVALMIQVSERMGYDELPAEDDNATREYLCFKAYLEANDAFNEWFHHYTYAKPKMPPPPSGENIRFKEKVMYEHEVKQYEVDLERWDHVRHSLGSASIDCLYNVLLFINGGWMIDQRKCETVDKDREKQLALLRKLCIPAITRLLQTVLFNEDRCKEAIQLADIICSEQHQLYKEFNTEDIQNFYTTSIEPCMSLVHQNLDPLGYPLQ